VPTTSPCGHSQATPSTADYTITPLRVVVAVLTTSPCGHSSPRRPSLPRRQPTARTHQSTISVEPSRETSQTAMRRLGLASCRLWVSTHAHSVVDHQPQQCLAMTSTGDTALNGVTNAQRKNYSVAFRCRVTSESLLRCVFTQTHEKARKPLETAMRPPATRPLNSRPPAVWSAREKHRKTSDATFRIGTSCRFVSVNAHSVVEHSHSKRLAMTSTGDTTLNGVTNAQRKNASVAASRANRCFNAFSSANTRKGP
jgi:hypothetical protein